MTQEQALFEFQEMFHDRRELQIERTRVIGVKRGHMNTFRLSSWQHGYEIIATSNRSWEHALAIAKSGNEDIWAEDDSPVEV